MVINRLANNQLLLVFKTKAIKQKIDLRRFLQKKIKNNWYLT